MKIISSDTSSIDIRLNESLTTAAGGVGDRGGIRFAITTDSGMIGLGETAPIPGFTGPGLESIAAELESWSADAPGHDVDDALEKLDVAELTPLARFAVHTALVDLKSAQAELPLSQWMRAGAPGVVNVNALVGESNPGAVHARVNEFAQSGMRAIKLKVGVEEPALDVTRIIAASEAAGPSIELRLDANQAWDAETVERVVGRVGKHRISYIEDPTPNIDEYSAIQAAVDVPIALDMAITADPLAELKRAGVNIVVIKPAAVGGIDRLLDLARAVEDMTVIVSSSIDREIALSAAIHVAAALPGPPQAHGLAIGAMVRNLPDELLAHDGVIQVPSRPGVYRP